MSKKKKPLVIHPKPLSDDEAKAALEGLELWVKSTK